MPNLEEQYENLYDFTRNFDILIQKNIFNGQNAEEVMKFGNEIMTLCKSKAFYVSTNDIISLNSFNELLIKTPDVSKPYLISQVEHFYTDIIEPSRDELY